MLMFSAHTGTHAHSFCPSIFSMKEQMKTNGLDVSVNYVLKEESGLNICCLFVF